MFSPELIELIINLFPHGYKIKLLKVRNDDCEVYMKNILAKIVEFRVSAQELQNTEISVDTSRKDRRSSGNSHSQSGSPSLVMYRPPRRDNNCRICKSLDEAGDTQDR